MTEGVNPDARVRLMAASDLGRVLQWRNHPAVRRWMFNRNEIAMTDHAAWFGKAQQNPRMHLLIFELAGQPIGYVNITGAETGGVADWGFYVAPESPRGTGRQLGRAALDYAFATLGMEKVCGQVIAYNERSLRLHDALGFQREAVLRGEYFDGESHHDVVHFGLTGSQWLAVPRTVACSTQK